MLDTLFLYVKFISGVVGGFLIMIGGTVEPSVGVWVVSLGGSLLSIALGPDKKIIAVFFYLFFGVCWGIFGSQVIHSITVIPQLAAAFFASMFGSEATWYILRSLRKDDMSSFLLLLLDKINPFSSLREKK